MKTSVHDPLIGSIADFFQREIERQRYADIQVVVRVHDGRVSLIEQTVSQKIKPTEKLGADNDTKR